MCTVTFIPQIGGGFTLTSNRDEAPNRKTLLPKDYTLNETRLLFPKDEIAGGTWIGLSERKRLICLLNGGFTAHERKEAYRMSRGVIVTDLLTTDNTIASIETYDFREIEPFTIILVSWEEELTLHELVWDGDNAHFSEMPWAPAIWSSSLLYTPEIKHKREVWFSTFLLEHVSPSAEEVLYFHTKAGEGNKDIDLIMDRHFVKTKSITQVTHTTETIMRYQDLQDGSITRITL